VQWRQWQQLLVLGYSSGAGYRLWTCLRQLRKRRGGRHGGRCPRAYPGIALLDLDRVTLFTPSYSSCLLTDLSLALHPGENLLVHPGPLSPLQAPLFPPGFSNSNFLNVLCWPPFSPPGSPEWILLSFCGPQIWRTAGAPAVFVPSGGRLVGHSCGCCCVLYFCSLRGCPDVGPSGQARPLS